MSIFGNIMSAIFGGKAQAQTAQPTAGSSGPAGSAASQPSSAGTTQSAPMGGQGGGGSASPAQGAVDVEAVLTKKAAQKGEKLDWRRSIVDLMKVLDLDSSLAARKSLAQELNYSGDTNDTATMNMWLHKQVMQKLAQNGGVVPEDLKN